MNTFATRLCSFLAVAALSACDAPVASLPDGWTDDFDAAKAKAAAEGKFILADFSGSDWCGWCQRLDSEVFSTDEFREEAGKRFVLLLVDSPRDKSRLSPKAAAQNPDLVERYGVQGFPTVLVLDADGAKLESTGYRKGGAREYLAHLNSLLASIEAGRRIEREAAPLAPASAERLAKLDEILSSLDDEGLARHEASVRELLAADPDGSFAAKYPFIALVKPQYDRLDAIFSELNDTFAARVKMLGHKPSAAERKAIAEAMNALAKPRLVAFRDEVKAAMEAAPASARGALSNLLQEVSSNIR